MTDTKYANCFKVWPSIQVSEYSIMGVPHCNVYAEWQFLDDPEKSHVSVTLESPFFYPQDVEIAIEELIDRAVAFRYGQRP